MKRNMLMYVIHVMIIKWYNLLSHQCSPTLFQHYKWADPKILVEAEILVLEK
jgi:hypothetical protein